MSQQLYNRLLATFPLLGHVEREAFVTGGAVRDLILGITPSEVDLAAPGAKELAASFAEATGSRLVDMGRERFTTYRVVAAEHEYDFSEIEESFEADVMRRDCSMNAVAVSLATGEVIDLTGGIADAKRRLIRMIREQNFVDDPLRVMKLVRLAVTRDCSIEPATLEAMKRHARALAEVAVERVSAELQKMLEDSRAHRGVALVRELRLDSFLFGCECDDEAEQRVKTLIEGDAVTRFAAATWSVAVDRRRAIVERFKWSDAQRRELDSLVALTTTLISGTDDVLMKLFDAGALTTERAVLLLGAVGAHEASLQVASLLRAHPQLFATRALLSGSEIQEIIGGPEGPEIGRLKRELLRAQLQGSVRSRDEAIGFVRRA